MGHLVCRALAAASAMGAAATAQSQIVLTEWTTESGLAVVHAPNDEGFPGPQNYQTGGMGVGDFNRDGCPDLFWVGGGDTPDRLFINDCDGSGHFTDQAAAWGVDAVHCGNGVAVGDYDGDGLHDIFVTSFGLPGAPATGSHRLYLNDGRGFTDVADLAGVSQSCQGPEPPDGPNSAGYGAAFGDFDLDGLLDLAVTSWWGDDDGNRLYRNEGDGTFTDVTDAAIGAALSGVWGFQPAFFDMDGDRYPELLIAADFETSRYLVNLADGSFVDLTVGSGTGLDDNGMGQAVGDFNNDGRLDWYVTSIHKDNPQPGDNVGNMLYLSLGGHQYIEISNLAGVNDGGWGWATLPVDLDQDTLVDIVEVNGRPGGGEWENERSYLFRNLGNAVFAEVAEASGFDHVGEGIALAMLDADQDGDRDLVAGTNAGELRYYRNDSTAGNGLLIALDTSNDDRLAPDGFGARVEATVGPATYVRYLASAPSYLATSELTVHFGLGAAQVVDELRVLWPHGAVTTIADVEANQTLVVASPVPGDLDANGVVDAVDFLALLADWGACPAPSEPCLADLDANGVVDAVDFLALLANWG